jgi:hypothetical protein
MDPKEHTITDVEEQSAKTIELLPCRYSKTCRSKDCKRLATVIARSAQHANQVTERERAKGTGNHNQE